MPIWASAPADHATQAEGRDVDDDDGDTAPAPPTWALPREISVPSMRDGNLHYTRMEIVATGDPGNYWTLREKVVQPPPVPLLATTSTMPGVVVPMAEKAAAY